MQVIRASSKEEQTLFSYMPEQNTIPCKYKTLFHVNTCTLYMYMQYLTLLSLHTCTLACSHRCMSEMFDLDPASWAALVAQLVRASVWSAECRGFESHLRQLIYSFFICLRCLSFFFSHLSIIMYIYTVPVFWMYYSVCSTCINYTSVICYHIYMYMYIVQ